MTKYEIIKRLCKERGITVSSVENDLGFAKGSLSKIDKHTPSSERMLKLSKFFQVPIGNLFLEESVYDYSVEDASRDRDMYVSERMRDAYQDALRNLHAPVWDMSAGHGRINDGYPDETISISNDETDEYGYVRISGDSMLPELRNGDIVKVHYQSETSKSDYTVIKINGDEETIKQVEVVENGVWLRALNKDVFEDAFYSIQDVISMPITIVGKATSIVSRDL